MDKAIEETSLIRKCNGENRKAGAIIRRHHSAIFGLFGLNRRLKLF